MGIKMLSEQQKWKEKNNFESRLVREEGQLKCGTTLHFLAWHCQGAIFLWHSLPVCFTLLLLQVSSYDSSGQQERENALQQGTHLQVH